MGKPLDQSEGEVDFSAAIYEYYADNAEKFLADEPITLLDGDGSALIRRGPVGVLLGIMPWNYPYYQVARFAGPNLTLGNTIVLKHAPQCPESAAALQQIFTDAGYPEGAYVNVYATNEQIADVDRRPTRARGFADRARSGPVPRSRRSRAATSRRWCWNSAVRTPSSCSVSDDLDATVEAAIDGRFENTGQACNAAKRFIVAEDIYDDFLDRFTKKVLEKADGLAPLSSVAAAERLDDQVKRAVADGATLVSEGERKGAFFPPGVLTGVSPTRRATKRNCSAPSPPSTRWRPRRGGRAGQRHPVRPRLVRVHHGRRAGPSGRRQDRGGHGVRQRGRRRGRRVAVRRSQAIRASVASSAASASTSSSTRSSSASAEASRRNRRPGRELRRFTTLTAVSARLDPGGARALAGFMPRRDRTQGRQPRHSTTGTTVSAKSNAC